MAGGENGAAGDRTKAQLQYPHHNRDTPPKNVRPSQPVNDRRLTDSMLSVQ
jgi:hypothetical protein